MWVLIVILYANAAGSSSVTTQEFTDQPKCEQARTFAESGGTGLVHVKALCTPK